MGSKNRRGVLVGLGPTLSSGLRKAFIGSPANSVQADTYMLPLLGMPRRDGLTAKLMSGRQ